MESPVWTPIGSKFSMEQTMMQLSLLSRTTSISYSFQPSKDSSIKSSCVGESSRPRVQIWMNSSMLYAIPPPEPPSVKLGRIMAGKPILAWTFKASSKEYAMPERALLSPILSIASLNLRRSSAFSTNFSRSSVSMIACTGVPITCTPYFSSTPLLASSMAQFSAV